jgi:hypothetical protein
LAGGNAAPVIAGLTVGIGFVVAFSLLSNIPACGAPGLQVAAPSLEGQVGYSSLVVYGTVMSADLQQVNWSPELGRAPELRYIVTISADRYVYDETGRYLPAITFREHGFGCAYPFRSEVNTQNPLAVEHKKGERALFFISVFDEPYLGKIESDWISFAFFDKYSIVEENKLQSKWQERRGLEPVPMQEFEGQIASILSNSDSPPESSTDQ